MFYFKFEKNNDKLNINFFKQENKISCHLLSKKIKSLAIFSSRSIKEKRFRLLAHTYAKYWVMVFFEKWINSDNIDDVDF